MNNGNTPSNNLNLPPPIAEQLPAAPAAAESEAFQPESQPAPSAEAAPAPLPTAIPAAIMPTPVNQSQNDATNTTISTPPIADDNDLIEKEWVLKAKEIVNKTKDNPYQQNKEMNVIKADYMQKRYNKTIKLNE